MRAPFVITIATSALSLACAKPSAPPESPNPPEPPHENPPAPVDSASAEAKCPASIEAKQACQTEGQICEPHEGCGFNGYRCESGAWKRMMTYCNPPRPESD